MFQVIVKRSDSRYAETVERLLAAVERRGLTLFAQVDHAAGAREAGLELADEQVLLIGNPLSGTQLMQSDPRVGVALPLKLLVWREDEHVLVGDEDPRALADAYDVAEHRATLEQMAGLLEQLAKEAAS
jgi:uncharacterized protein (DUF302 family)